MTEEERGSDARLLFERIARGDSAALGELYDAYSARLHGYALSLLGTRTDAEEALQEAFLGLARARRSLAGVASPTGYLFRAVRNAALAIGKRRRGAPLEAIPEPCVEGREGVDPAEVEAVNARLAALPPEQREVVMLKVYGELTFREIAELLEVPANTVQSRYRYALEKLRGGAS